MALVLSRLRDQTICIGKDIFVTVCDVRGEKVRLAITAPPDVTVDRKEVRDSKDAAAAPAAAPEQGGGK